MEPMSREDRENVREVEEMLARASNIPDITGADGTVLVPGGRPDHLPPEPLVVPPAGVASDIPSDEISEEVVIPEGQPQNFREMTYWMRDEVANGNVIIGWHPTGVAWFCDLGDEIEEGVEVVDPDHEDAPVLLGIMMMQLVGQSQAQALREAVAAQKMIAAQRRIVVPGVTENRKVRRARERARAKEERGQAQGLIIPG